MWLKISNKGLIDPNALVLMGASSKREDNTKIGFFGTGIKYALAVLMRNKIPVRIFNGLKEIEVATKDVEFRGKSYSQILIDGRETSITTDIGVDWVLWYAIREIYCNAIDEGEESIENTEDSSDNMEDRTSIYIFQSPEIIEILKNWDLYFSKGKTPLYSSEYGTIYKGDGKTRIFRKGILVYESEDPSLFHWDLPNIDVNESRVVKYNPDIKYHISTSLPGCNKESIIKKVLDSFQYMKDYLEYDSYWSYGGFSEQWKTLLQGLTIIPKEYKAFYSMESMVGGSIVLPLDLITALKKDHPDLVVIGTTSKGTPYKILDKSEKQKCMIADALHFLVVAGYSIEYPIEVCDFQSKEILGTIGNNNLLISWRTFDKGKKFVIEVIFEEWVHQKFGYKDCCRDMQNYLFEQLMTVLEEKTKIYL